MIHGDIKKTLNALKSLDPSKVMDGQVEGLLDVFEDHHQRGRDIAVLPCDQLLSTMVTHSGHKAAPATVAGWYKPLNSLPHGLTLVPFTAETMK